MIGRIQGVRGNGIASITKTGTQGLVDTYTITFTNGNTSTFTVTNGQNGTGAVADVWVNDISVLDEHTAKITVPTKITDLTNDSDFVSRDVIADEYSTSSTYAVGDYCIYDGQLYRCTTAITTAEAWTAGHWEAVNVGDELIDLKGDLTELQSDGVVASSEQLLSDNYTIDQTPYIYRQTNSNGSDRAYEEIVGGTVAWNQLISPSGYNTQTVNGVTMTKNDDGSVTFSGTATADATFSLLNTRNNPLVKGRVYYVHTCPENGGRTTYYGGVAGLRYDFGDGAIFKHSYDWGTTDVRLDVASGATINGTVYPQYIDLTAMFGSTIADYIYSLEQANAGAGVAWFRKLFPKTYYAYDEGSLKSVEGVSAHVTTGKNLLPNLGTAKTENGITFTPQADGSVLVNGTATATATYRMVTNADAFTLPEGAYIVTGEKNSNQSIGWSIGGTTRYATTGSGAQFTLDVQSTFDFVFIRIASGQSLSNVVFYPMIRLASVSDATYEPYEKHSYPLDSSLTLRGIPKLDTSNNLYYDGDVYSPSGEVNRRYKETDIGTLTWVKTNAGYFEGYSNTFSNEIKRPNGYADVVGYLLSNGFTEATSNSVYSGGNKVFAIRSSTGNIWIRDDAYSDAATFKTAMSGVYLVYELATPTTEQAQPYTDPQKVYPDGTEEYVTTGIVPVGHYTKYPENLRAKIEGLPWDLSMIAPIENGTTASKAYQVGQYFLKDNQFCKAKTAIASGATFTLGTNYEVTTVAAELYAAMQ